MYGFIIPINKLYAILNEMRIVLLIVLITIVGGCRKNSDSRVDYHGYSIGNRIDSLWNVKSEDKERKFKYLQYQIDTNFICRTVADTIWSLIVFELSEQETNNLRHRIEEKLNMQSDCTYHPSANGKFESYNFNWMDSRTGDLIDLSKIRMNPAFDFSTWFLEIRNDSLLDKLNRRHDPFYQLNAPIINDIK
jgi:hypothetical protein